MTSTAPNAFPYGDVTAVPAPGALAALRTQAAGKTAELGENAATAGTTTDADDEAEDRATAVAAHQAA